jgi:hypothetical protein
MKIELSLLGLAPKAGSVEILVKRIALGSMCKTKNQKG